MTDWEALIAEGESRTIEFKQLVESGRLTLVGKGRGAYYTLAK